MANKKKPYSLMAARSVLVLICVLAYANSLDTPFILDDVTGIIENPSIRSLSWETWTTPREQGHTLAGRPLVQWTLAANFALDGLGVRTYHAFNILLHTLAALFLFGIVRLTLTQEKTRETFGRASVFLAFSCAGLWALHPLNTQAVTYVIQRCESLMGLCFLAGLYFSVRGWQSSRKRTWHLLALLSYALGMGAKEVIVVLPPVIFLYDYVFIRENAKKTFAESKLLYGGLVLGWVPLILLANMAGLGQDRTGPLPYGALDYLLTQTAVIWHYIGLALWPKALCLDYGPWPRGGTLETLTKALALLSLVLFFAWKLRQRRPSGFVGACFFLILIPTSSILPLADPAFEHRMYLPLACLVTLVVTALFALGKKQARLYPKISAPLAVCGVFLVLGLMMALGTRTHLRNRDYRTPILIWTDTVNKRPDNARAHLNLGDALAKSGQDLKAMQSFQRALTIEPQNGMVYFNMGAIWQQRGMRQLASDAYQRALFFQPNLVKAQVNLGTLMMENGDLAGALSVFRQVVLNNPTSDKAHVNLAIILEHLGKSMEARTHIRKALELNPENPVALSFLETIRNDN